MHMIERDLGSAYVCRPGNCPPKENWGVRRGRDEWREQAHRLALLAPKAEPVQPKPEPAQIEQPSRLCRPWRWMRAIGCLAGAGSLLALSTVPAGAQQQQPRNSRRRDASRLR